MPGELLSRDELESLLRAPAANGTGRAPRSAEAFHWPALQSGGLRVAQPLAEAELVRLRALQQKIARRLSQAAETLVGCPLRVEPKQTSATDGRAWLERGPRPAVLLVLAGGVDGGRDGHVDGGECLLVEIGHDVLGAIMDRMLGGGPDTAPLEPRPLTEIEGRLAARFAAVLCGALESVWQPAARFALQRVECDPHECHEARTQGRLLELGFALNLGRTSGWLALAVPEGLVPGESGARQEKPTEAADAEAVSENEGAGNTVEVTVRLADTQITAGQLLGLQVGDVIKTDHPHDQPLDVHLDGQPRWKGHVGAAQGRKAVRLVDEGPGA